MAPNTDGLVFIGKYQDIFQEVTGRRLPVNKYALRAHANALVEEYGLSQCIETARYFIENYDGTVKIQNFMYRFSEINEALHLANRDALVRNEARARLYEAMRQERRVSE
jgi:hypothetical protein